jgi:2-polyprenyl-3-methyl-5-hydroxy-6-metoxy-1,4-benzoquinol methylase
VSKNKTDPTWEQFGRVDPYFGVLSQPRFRAASQAGPDRDEFFRSGVAHIERVFSIARDLAPNFAPNRALDFGCGVGRLVLPLARTVPEVVGMDISPGMLMEAQRNCERADVANVTLCRSDDSLSQLEGSFDFIHSFIVFQHIPVGRGMAITKGLLDRLNEGGIGALHFPYANTRSIAQRLAYVLSTRIPGAHMALNILRGRSARQGAMQMNSYPLDHLYALLQAHGCHRVSTYFSDHSGHLGALLVFQRRALQLF